MKIMLSGATGFVGGEVLDQALSHPLITSIVCLTRRALPKSIMNNPKVKIITMTDFTSYSPEILSQLEGAEACIWAMGVPAGKSSGRFDECRKVEIEYTQAAASTFTKVLAPPLKAKGKTFRFVYTSGMFVEQGETKSMWFLKEQRTIKGQAENALLALQKQEGSNLEVSFVRPGGIMAKDTLVPNLLLGTIMLIRIDELAAAMIGEVVENVPGTRILENNDLRSRGNALLKK